MLFCPLQLPSADSPAHCLVGVNTEAALVDVPAYPLPMQWVTSAQWVAALDDRVLCHAASNPLLQLLTTMLIAAWSVTHNHLSAKPSTPTTPITALYSVIHNHLLCMIALYRARTPTTHLVLYTSDASSIGFSLTHTSVTLHLPEEAAHLAGWTAS